MKKSKKVKKTKKAKKSFMRYKWLLPLALTCVLFLLGGIFYFSTLSVLTDHDNESNQFGFADLRTEIEEEWNDLEKFDGDEDITKKISIKNKGTQPIFVRVMLLPSIMGKDDDEDDVLLPASYAPPFVDPSDSMILDLSVDDIDKADYQWKDGEDGYFYYLEAIDPGKSSQKIIDTVSLITANLPEDIADEYIDAKMKIEVKVEATGLSKYAFRDAFWSGVTPNQVPLKDIDESFKELVDQLHPEKKADSEKK